MHQLSDFSNRFVYLLEELESNTIPLKKHIRGIAEYFYSKYNYQYYDVANWFWLASSIDYVNYSGVKYDSAFIMCSPARDYEISKEDLHSNLVNDLTPFLFVYSGYECLLNQLGISSDQNLGKIKNSQKFIKDNFSYRFRDFPLYKSYSRLLRLLIKNSALSECEKHFSLDVNTDIFGVAIKVIYQLRNRLAHGDFRFPEPVEHNTVPPIEPEIMRISIRLILFTIQIIMLSMNYSCFENLFFLEDYAKEELNDEEYMINEYDFLMTFHVIDQTKDKYQTELNLNLS